MRNLRLGIAALLASAACLAAPDDPYAWLEDVSGTRALAWVRAENARTTAVLDQDPRFAAMYRDALAIASARDRIPTPHILAGRILNQWQDADHEHGVWRTTTFADYRQADPHWRVILDLDDLAKTRHVNWFLHDAVCAEPAERSCLLGLSDGGEDAVTYREYDVEAAGFVPGGFELPRGKQDVAWEDPDTLLAAREWTPGELTRSGYAYVVKRLRRGQAPEAAEELFRGSPDDVGVSPLGLHDGAGGQALLIVQNRTFFEARYFLVRGAGVVPLALPPKIDVQALVTGRLVLSLREDWRSVDGVRFPQGAVVAVDLRHAAADPRHLHPTLVYAPGPRESFQQARASRGRLLITALDDVRGRAYAYTPARGGWSRRRLPLPENSAVDIVDADLHGDTAFLQVTGYLTPTSLWLANLADGSVAAIKTLPARFDASGHVVEQLQATSADGTRIPYFLVRPKDMHADGGTPTVMTAYGGFQIAEVPTYLDTTGKLWLERGGAFVDANIRGGGEFGPAWHEAGLKTHRQRIYDDFYAVARDLFARGITTPKHLGIVGGSNGGLLMGVEFTQHPEAFGAVDIAIPLLDMLGYEHIDAGASWVGEYGSVAIPEERAFLASISPYENLRAGVPYPEALVWTTTKDDRVGPQHARKFAAKLAALGSPYYFYEIIEGGHSDGATLAEQAAMRAREYVYFARRLMSP